MKNPLKFISLLKNVPIIETKFSNWEKSERHNILEVDFRHKFP